jgi:excisionase family DNA binding protein
VAHGSRSVPPLPAFEALQQIAEAWGVSVSTVRREVRRGNLVVHRFGGQLRISREDRLAYERARRQPRPA